ncbi:hypothetical protein BDW22DRAFT_1360217 [Trametopsis cervina]|nr:hypothetical protein BDW22DRAFT_1360217 [Trametopsis cervina]
MSKKSQASKARAAAPTGAFTKEQWKQLKRHKALMIKGVTFREKDDVILHSREDMKNPWVAKLRQIRVHKNKIWICVQWYQSPKDVGALINSFNPALFCRMERFMSDEVDILSSECLEAVTHVYRYMDQELESLQDITPGDFFQRFSVGRQTKDISPVPGESACLPHCARVYNPFPIPSKVKGANKYKNKEVDVTWDPMHLCPRPQCNRRWYHRSCLLRAGYFDSEPSVYVGDRCMRLLAADPDYEEYHPAFEPFTRLKSPTPLTPSNNIQGHASIAGEAHTACSLLHSSISGELSHLPPELIAIAAQPIVRCALAPASLSRASLGVFSTAGTVKEVLLARRLIYQALNGGHRQLDQICSQLPLPKDPQVLDADIWQAALAPIRILASPHPEYWRRRVGISEPEFVRDLDCCPPVVCPQCLSAI